MTPRLARLADVPELAALHVKAWDETYTGLLPPSEFARRNLRYRLELWRRIIAASIPVSYLPGIGFAQMSSQRDLDLLPDYPDELYSLYTLKHAHGSDAGLALLKHALGPAPRAFTADVLLGNARATRFYEKIGAERLKERPELIDGQPIKNIVFGWSVPIQLLN